MIKKSNYKLKKWISTIIHKLRNETWEFIRKYSPLSFHKCENIVITFSGGMGAQMISAAIYYHLRENGKNVYADMSYFDKPPHKAVMGITADISHWQWQLDYFDIYPESFESLPKIHRSRYQVIFDGRRKTELGLKALSSPTIRAYFDDLIPIDEILPMDIISKYVCIHIRRGDYVNVASHLVPDKLFIDIAKKLSSLVNHLVIVSDSPINEEFRIELPKEYSSITYLDSADAITTHRVMRNARALVCSNSQFSLIAALLNTNALVIIPKKWFGKGNEELEIPINKLCSFQIIDY
jgi:hypothetical protein